MPVTPITGRFGSAQVGFFLIDGYNMRASKPTGLRYKIACLQQPSHGLGDTWFESTPTGTMQAEFGQEGAFFDTTVNSIHDALKSAGATDPNAVVRLLGFTVSKNAIGQPAICASGLYQGAYEVLAQLGNLTKANAEQKLTGIVENCVILHAHGVETAAGNTQATSVDASTIPQTNYPISNISVNNPTQVTTAVPHLLSTGDVIVVSGSNSTPSINGQQIVTVIDATHFTVPVNVTVLGNAGSFTKAQASGQINGYLFVEQGSVVLGGYTSWTIKIRHSADDITYVDLITFTNVTTGGAQRVNAPTTVNRYLATSVALNGAGAAPSIKYMVALARFS